MKGVQAHHSSGMPRLQLLGQAQFHVLPFRLNLVQQTLTGCAGHSAGLCGVHTGLCWAAVIYGLVQAAQKMWLIFIL